MREALKNLFAKQLTLENGTIFYYTISPFEMKNSLGQTVAVLTEYFFTKKEDESGTFSCKLYKTKENSWYDFEQPKMIAENSIFRALKSAVDAKEGNALLYSKDV